MVARENETEFAGLVALVIFFLDHVYELLNQVKHAVPRPYLLPQVSRGEALPRGRIARTEVGPLIEWQKPGLGPAQVRRDIN